MALNDSNPPTARPTIGRTQSVTTRRFIHLFGWLVGGIILQFMTLPAPAVTEEKMRDVLQNHLRPHPRLLLPPGAGNTLRAKIAGDPLLKKIAENILADACELLPQTPPTRQLVGKRLLTVSREYLRRITILAMAWEISGDRRFCEKATGDMLAAAAFTDWHPEHFLDTAEMTAAVAIGYDWLQNEMPPGDRQVVLQAILKKGLQPSLKGKPWWVNAENNWNQVCHGGLTLGALAIADVEPKIAAKILARAVNNLPYAMQSYAPDGAYPEGPGYYEYGTTYNALLVAALESALGQDFGLSAQPGFLQSASYLLYATGPTGRFHNYSDCGAEASLLPAVFWIAKKNLDPSVLYCQSQFLEKRVGGTSSHPGNKALEFIPLWLEKDFAPAPPETLDWVGQGTNPVAFFRSSWDRKAAYVGIKAGSPSVNHGHMDVGSFVFDADGVRWVHDPGMQEYQSLESAGIDLWNMRQTSSRWKVFRLSNHSHATLIIDGALQNVSGHAGLLTSDLGGISPSATVDLSEIYSAQANKVVRTFHFENRRSLLISDVLEGISGKTIRWQIPTLAEAKLDGPQATLIQDGRSLTATIISPKDGSWKISDAAKPRAPFDAPNPGLKLLAADVVAGSSDRVEIIVRLSPAH